MKYKKSNINGYHLHMIKTDKFNSVLMMINIKMPINNKEITYNSLLINYLMLATNEYRTAYDLDVAKEELYSLSSWSNQKVYFNVYLNKIVSQFLNEKYTKKGCFEKSINFSLSYLLNPLLDGDNFNQQIFDQAKNILQINIKSRKEKKMKYALDRLFQEMGEDRGFGYHVLGNNEDLGKITANDLYNYYQTLLKKIMVDIFIIGSIDFEKTNKIVSKALNFSINQKDRKIEFINDLKKKKVNIIKEVKEIDQSVLSLGYIIGKLTEFEKQYVSYVYNYILGDSTDSLLFKEVREKNSLCYSISSNISNDFNIMTILAGINKESYNKALNLIKKQVARINTGDFNNGLIKQAQDSYINICKASLDSDIAIINDYQNKVYFKYDLVDKQMKRIKLVTKEDVIKMSHKIHLDTIFFLEGSGKNE